MQAHRRNAHHPGNPISWVLFAATKEENDKRLQKGKVNPIHGSRVDPNSPNYDTIADATKHFNDGF